MKEMTDRITQCFQDSSETKLKFIQENADKVSRVIHLIVEAFRRGNKVLLFGNGGSATDASHIAAEFVNRFFKDREALPSIALNTDMSVITSISNDSDYTEVFSRQIQALGARGDIAIGISTSGNSPNVLKGVEAAKKKGLLTIGFTGGTGGKLAGMVDHPFVVPSRSTPRIQETHITLGHVICEMVEETLFGAPEPKGRKG